MKCIRGLKHSCNLHNLRLIDIMRNLPLLVWMAIGLSLAMGTGLTCPTAAECLSLKIFPSSQPTPAPQHNPFLHKRLDEIKTASTVPDPDLSIHCVSVISEYYEKHDYKFLWVLENGLIPQAEELIQSIEKADRDGLTVEDYHLTQLKSLKGQINQELLQNQLIDPAKKADLDLLLTDAFLLFSSHLLYGRVNPGAVDSTWLFSNPVTDVTHLLESVNQNFPLEGLFNELRPENVAYYRLRDALQDYITIQKNGGWPSIPGGAVLKKGAADPRIKLILKRLAITGDIHLSDPPSGNHVSLDGYVMEGVKRFQNRHGIDPNGWVSQSTLDAMNVPVEDRIHQIELNLERWRWIPRDLGSQYVLVNIADYSLAVIDNQMPVLEMRVVVGKAFRRTPVFSEKIRFMVFNPYWNIPIKIAIEDKLPIIRKNPGYLSQNHIKVFENWGENAPEVNPATIDWYRVTANHFPYRLRQDPGPSNALGRIKFMFPNKFSIYLHDTSQRGLFRRTSRDFSSGCIRIEKPVELAAYLLRNDPQWSTKRIMDVIASGVSTVVRLKDPIPVHLLYLTAWVDEQEDIHFSKDIYDRDPPLERALKAQLNDTVHVFPTPDTQIMKAENQS